MGWGLTVFERRRLAAIALDHPYFDARGPLLSKREMAAIVRQAGKAGHQVIAEAMAELGLPYTPAAPRRRTFGQALRDVSFVPSFRRTVAVAVLCLLLALFMTLTVPGKAMAEELYSIIVTFTRGSFQIRNETPTPPQGALDFSLVPPTAKEPEELARISRLPVLLTEDEVVSFEYDTMGEVLFVFTVYRTPAGRQYTVLQDFYGPNTVWSSSVDAEEVFEVESRIGYDGPLALYAGTSSDGTVFLKGYSDHFTLYISSMDMPLLELENCMLRFYVWQEEGGPADGPRDLSQVPPKLESPTELAAVCHFPILLSADEMIDFQYSKSKNAVSVRTWYQTEDSRRYRVYQVFRAPDSMWGSTIDAEEYAEIPSSIRYDGEIVLYAGTTVDGDAFIQGQADVFGVTITSADMPLLELESCVSRMWAWREPGR